METENTTVIEILDAIKVRIVNLELICNPACAIIESHGWIVTFPNSSTAYSFTVIPHPTIPRKFQPTDIRMDYCEKCNRFTKSDAMAVASDCKLDGGGTLVARHYRDVCKQELAILNDIVQRLSTSH